MNKTILALAFIAVSGTAAAQPTIRLSDIPPGAIHTPGIGPGYIFPSYGSDIATTSESTLPTTSMMPGAVAAEQVPVMGTSEAWALQRLRVQGFTNVHNLRQAPDGSWHGMVMQRGGMASVSVDADGAVSFRQ